MNQNMSGSATIGGVSVYFSRSIDTDDQYAHQAGGDNILAVGQAGVLTRSDANTGVSTLSTGHGIVNSDVCDVFWEDGCRHGMIATVSVNAVTLDGGAGDDLPSEAATAVVVCKVKEITVSLDGDSVEALMLHTTRRGCIVLLSAGDTEEIAHDLAANEGYFWPNGSDANPIAGDTIVAIRMSNGDSANTNVATAAIGF